MSARARLLALSGVRVWGAVTPVGGLALIARTRRIPRVMLPDGYAVVFRASDGVHAAWWTTDEFNERFPIESSRPGE